MSQTNWVLEEKIPIVGSQEGTFVICLEIDIADFRGNCIAVTDFLY